MEQQIITLVNQHIAQLFIEVKNILLHPDSYSENVETKNLLDYFRFLESALNKPYNRLVSLAEFVNDKEGILSHQMYPLIALKGEAKQIITSKCSQATRFVNAFDVGEIDPKIKLLCMENREHIK